MRIPLSFACAAVLWIAGSAFGQSTYVPGGSRAVVYPPVVVTPYTPYYGYPGYYSNYRNPYYRGYPYNGYGNYGYGTTPAESYMRGLADVVRAQGEYNLNTSQARINLTEVRRREIENRKLWTETYFAMRQINRQAREAERQKRASAEDLIRYAQLDKPKRLGPSDLDGVTGQINWPPLLQLGQFEPQRAALEEAFAQRADRGTMGIEDLMKVIETSNTILADMKKKIRSYPADQYMMAKRFLESLAYEARLPSS